MLRAEWYFGLVDLDEVLKGTAIGSDHRPAELVQQQPGSLVAAKAQLGLQLKRGDPVGMAGHDVRGEKPGPERQVAAMHHRASCHRGLPTATGTLPRRAPAPQRPALSVATGRAYEAVRPPALGKIPGARFLVGEAFIKGLTGHRPVVFPASGHDENNRGTKFNYKPH